MDKLISDVDELDLMPVDFIPAAHKAIELADKGLFHLSVELPGGKTMSVGRFIRQFGLAKLVNWEAA